MCAHHATQTPNTAAQQACLSVAKLAGYAASMLFGVVIFVVLLPIYVAAARYGVNEPRRPTFLFVGVVFCVVSVAVIDALANAPLRYASWAAAILFTVVVAFPLGVVGSGLVTGVLAGALPRSRSWRAVRVAVIATPVVALSTGVLIKYREHNAQVQQRQVALHDAQGGFVKGQMGQFDVQIPVRPRAIVTYRCSRRNSNSVTECWTHFSSSAVLRRPYTPTGEVEFLSLRLPQAITDCEGKHCDAADAETAWCARRTDLNQDLWCQMPNRLRIAKSSIAPKPNHSEYERWTQRTVSNDTVMFCETHDRRLHCMAESELVPGIFATVTLSEPDTAAAQRAISHARALWADMTQFGS